MPPRRGFRTLAQPTLPNAADAAPNGSAAGPVPAAPFGPDAVPAPYEGPESGDLSAQEQQHLQVCEAAIDNLRRAFAAAGRALAVIQRGRLYRQTHPTFEAYVTERWDMRTSQAYRLIQAWPIAEALSPMGDKINERQVRELIPVAEQHGTDAAVTVYETVAETLEEDGRKVTAAVLGGVVKALPEGRWDPAEAVEQIRAYLAGGGQALEEPADSGAEWRRQTERVRTSLRRTIASPRFLAAAREHPDEARTVAEELRELAAEIEAAAQ